MDSVLCRLETRRTARLIAVAVLGAVLSSAQDWRRVGGTSIELGLAAPASGPVERVWFADDGRILAKLSTGSILSSADGEQWADAAVAEPPRADASPSASLPRGATRLASTPALRSRLIAGGAHLYRSDDGGRNWTVLTEAAGESLLGGPLRDFAISPRNPDLILAANDFGLWRTADGGLSWSGLNSTLPNFRARRLLATPSGLRGARVWLEGLGAAELFSGASRTWVPVADEDFERLLATRRSIGTQVNATVTAVASSGDFRYAGSADGRLWLSSDRGRSWRPASAPQAGLIESIWVDPSDSRAAVAVASGRGARVLRTTNTGVTWDDVSTGLPDGAVYGVAADRESKAIFLASERGVFWSRTDLDSPAAAGEWIRLNNLPNAPARDVALGADNNQLFVAIDGHGLCGAAPPHRAGQFRLLSAADYQARPAAPGSLVSVLGGKVDSARAGTTSLPVLASSETESQLQIPFSAEGSLLDLALEAAGRTVRLPLPLAPASPAIFVDREGTPMLIDADSGMLFEAGHTARAGMRVQVLATGLGRVRPEWPTGLAAPIDSPPAVVAPVSVMLDRSAIEVTRATLAPGYVGFYLIEFYIPAAVNAGPAELSISVDGRVSNRVRLYLEP